MSLPPLSVPLKGRGAASNADGRFESCSHERVDDGWDALAEPLPPVSTTVTVDTTKSALNYVDSPDIGFDRSINAYRGCEHGCIYCLARPSHSYLGLSPGLDFETRLFAKPNAAQILEQELRHRNYQCQPIALGTNTDPYQPIERQWRITRQILEVLWAFKHPVIPEYDMKVTCCGGALAFSEPDKAQAQIKDIVESAYDHGAEMIVTPCPLCQANVEIYQGQVNKRYGTKFDIPVLYYSQLMVIAYGGNAKQAGLNGQVIRARRLEEMAAKPVKS